MTRIASVLFVLALLVVPFALLAGEVKGPVVANFTLKDTAGKACRWPISRTRRPSSSSSSAPNARWSTLYLPRLAELHKEFAEQGRAVPGHQLQQPGHAERVAEHAKAARAAVPGAQGRRQQRVADLFGRSGRPRRSCSTSDRASPSTAAASTISSASASSGRQADAARPGRGPRRGAGRQGGQRRPSTEARRLPHRPRRSRRPTATVTFTKHVAPILQKHCQECHRPGQIGPMPLLTYDDAIGLVRRRSARWSRTAACRRGTPTRKHGKFSQRPQPAEGGARDAARLDRAGLPQGRRQGPAAAADVRPRAGGSASRTWSSRCRSVCTVPAETPREWRAVPVLQSCRPTSRGRVGRRRPRRSRAHRAVVHHIIVFVVAPGDKLQPQPRTASAAAARAATPPATCPPMLRARAWPRRFPTARKLVFQMHYTPNGKAQKDRSSVGLIFAKEPPKHEVRTRADLQRDFPHPAGRRAITRSTSSHDVRAGRACCSASCRTCTCAARTSSYEAVYPDGKTRDAAVGAALRLQLADATIALAEPLPAAGRDADRTARPTSTTRTKNPNNPDPTQGRPLGRPDLGRDDDRLDLPAAMLPAQPVK